MTADEIEEKVVRYTDGTFHLEREILNGQGIYLIACAHKDWGRWFCIEWREPSKYRIDFGDNYEVALTYFNHFMTFF